VRVEVGMWSTASSVRFVFLTILAMFVMGIILRLLVPAITGRHDTLARRRAYREMVGLMELLRDHTASAADGQFPPSLGSLFAERRRESGVDSPASLTSRYWYTPGPANLRRDSATPLLIERTNNYRRYHGGVVAFSAYNMRWADRDEHLSLIARYAQATESATECSPQSGSP
jgi:hypothetical protein